MLRRKSGAKRGRSSAQYSHISSLTARRRELVSGDLFNNLEDLSEQSITPTVAGPSDPTLVDCLRNVERDLVNTQKREKRAKENSANSKDKLVALTQSEHKAQLALCDAEKSLDNSYGALEDLECQNTALLERCTALEISESLVREFCNELQAKENLLQIQVAEIAGLLAQTRVNADNEIQALRERTRTLRLNRDAARKKLSRISERHTGTIAHTPTNTYGQPIPQEMRLKDQHGAIRPIIRDLVRKLIADNHVGTEHISSVITNVTAAFNVVITDTISARSVSRIVLEGLIQAKIQLAYEMNRAECMQPNRLLIFQLIEQVVVLSICGDGTSIKNQQYEARGIHIPIQTYSWQLAEAMPGQSCEPTITPVLRVLGVHKASSHTAQSQLVGWAHQVDLCYQLLDEGPLEPGNVRTSRDFASKLRGISTDHAADQKRLVELIRAWKAQCNREIRGEAVMKSISKEALAQKLSEHLEEVLAAVTDWDKKSAEEQNATIRAVWNSLVLAAGDKAIEELTDAERQEMELLVWTGCCMHKELNAVKGGVTQMMKMWAKNNLTPPMALRNKFEASKTDINARPNEDSRGAVKLASLLGAILNNKDDKKGQHETYRFSFQQQFGYSAIFPDTSNTRYGSHCDAAAELLVNLDIYISFLQQVHDAKGTPGFTNIESNAFMGLQNIETLTELAVLALYAQAIGRPYMVRQHCRAIISAPSLLLSKTSCAATGALGGGVWDRPDVIYCILNMVDKLPHLEKALIAFFEGALVTWERFTTEFAVGGAIEGVTAPQRASIYNTPTNDRMEGLLGQSRQMKRQMPTITDNQRNARTAYKQNNTSDFVAETFSAQDHAFVRAKAREVDASGAERTVCMEQHAAWADKAQAGREKQARQLTARNVREKRVAAIKLMESPQREDLVKLTHQLLGRQIDKLRATDNTVPAKSSHGLKGNKAAKAEAILAGLARCTFNSNLIGVLEERTELYQAVSYEEDIPMDEDMDFEGDI
ncbi:hypothetical protein BDV93DRAFT_564910 [Ceratobasidium sp. AG-I]|nr:hypothetical protein BDV93DRAFT_564910 [Ceratobasidium sp. AG-I]